MNPQKLPELLGRQDFLRDLHHLLWTAPRLNERVNVFDEGWSCRDHALIVAGITRMLGFSAVILHGNASFVQGRGADTQPVAMDMREHSWVGVEDGGWCDLSVRLDSVVQLGSEWKDWRVDAIVGSRVLPENGVRLVRADTPMEFENEVSGALDRAGTNTAVYCDSEYSELTANVIAQGSVYCNSLLTEWLEAEFGRREDFHAKAILHLLELLQGRTSPVAVLPKAAAWKKLIDRPGDALWRVCSRGRIA